MVYFTRCFLRIQMKRTYRFCERSVTSLRKILFAVILVLLLALSASALARTSCPLSPAPLQVELRDNRTVVTPETLGQHPELLTAIGMSKEDTLADWQARGVVLQAWKDVGSKKYSCLEITVVQDAESAGFPDMLHKNSDRAAWNEWIKFWRSADHPLASRGYKFENENIVAHTPRTGNCYLELTYKCSGASGMYRGTMARTVCDGYTIVFDLKVYNMMPVSDNKNELYYAVDSLSPAAVAPAETAAAPAPGGTGESGQPENSAAGQEGAASLNVVPLDITKAPPAETNTNSFTVEGVTSPGMQVIGVMMKNVGDPMPQRFETVSHARTGAFSLKITVPESEESVWLMTLSVYENAESAKALADKVFEPTTYKKTLIPFTLDNPVPEDCYSDELVIAGTTMKAVDVQCTATNSAGQTVTTQKSHPNGTGRFTFKIPLKEEDTYEIAIVVTKKDYDTKRFIYKVSRFMTEEARQQLQRKQVLRGVGYGAVAARTDQYVGKILSFSVWITEIEQVGDEWRITAAGSKTGDHYTQLMVYIAEQEPSFAVGDKHTLFGKCTGTYPIQSEESTEVMPRFDLLFWD